MTGATLRWFRLTLAVASVDLALMEGFVLKVPTASGATVQGDGLATLATQGNAVLKMKTRLAKTVALVIRLYEE